MSAVCALALFADDIVSRPVARDIEMVAVVLITVMVLIQLRQGSMDRAAAEQLRRQFAVTAATCGGWVYVVNPEGRFVYSSAASREFLGYEATDLLGREAQSLLNPLDVPHIDSRVGDLPQRADVVVVRGRHCDGTDHWFEVTVAPVLDLDNRVVLGYGGTARLITDDKHPVILREIHRRGVTELLRSEDLVIAFQPIVDLATGRMLGVEALSRFPSRPETTPDVVFAEALSAGLGLELELLAVRQALFEARLLDPSLYVAVNVSPVLLANPSLIDALQVSGIDLSRIVVEVTEHASVSDYTGLTRPRQRLRDLGVRLAIDDAGAGYSSLRHIVTLAPDIIKIDRALIADLNSDRARRALVMAVVVYAMEIGTTKVIGEGVETTEELDALKSLGADAAQGYLLGRPSTSPEDWFAWSTRFGGSATTWNSSQGKQ